MSNCIFCNNNLKHYSCFQHKNYTLEFGFYKKTDYIKYSCVIIYHKTLYENFYITFYKFKEDENNNFIHYLSLGNINQKIDLKEDIKNFEVSKLFELIKNKKDLINAYL